MKPNNPFLVKVHARENQHQASKACQEQLRTILLTAGLVIIGLGTFIDM